ncbi:hypothetical protein MMPV_003554 [Pyropia vietnamensis]
MAAAATQVRRPAVPPAASVGHGTRALGNVPTGVALEAPMVPPPPPPLPPLPVPPPSRVRAVPVAGDEHPQRPLTAYFTASSGGSGGSAAQPARRAPRGELAASDGCGAGSSPSVGSGLLSPPLPASVTVGAPPPLVSWVGGVGLATDPSAEPGAAIPSVPPPVLTAGTPVSASVAEHAIPAPIGADVVRPGSSRVKGSTMLGPEEALAAATARAAAAEVVEEETMATAASMEAVAAVTEDTSADAEDAAAADAAMAAAAAVMAAEASLHPVSFPVLPADAVDAVPLVATAGPTIADDAGIVVNAGPPLPVIAGVCPAAVHDVTALAPEVVSRVSSPIPSSGRAAAMAVGTGTSAVVDAVSVAHSAATAAPLPPAASTPLPPPGWAYQRLPGVTLTPSASHERQAARLAKRLAAAHPAGSVVDRWRLAPSVPAGAPIPACIPLGASVSDGNPERDGSGGDSVNVGIGAPAGATADAPRLAPIFGSRRSSRVSATHAAAEAGASIAAGVAATDGRPPTSGTDVAESRRMASVRPARAVRLAKPASGQCTLDAGASAASTPVVGVSPVAAATAATAAAAVVAPKRPRRVAPLHPFFTTAPPAARTAGAGRSGSGAGDRLPPGTSGATEPPLPPPPDAWLSSLSSRHVGALPPLLPPGRPLLDGYSQVAAGVSLPLAEPSSVDSESPGFSCAQLLDGIGVADEGDPEAAPAGKSAKLIVASVAGAEGTIGVDETDVGGAVSSATANGDDNRSVQTTAWVDLYQLRAGIGATTGGRQLASWIRRFYGSCGPGSTGSGGRGKGIPGHGRGKRQRRSTATPPPPTVNEAIDSTDGRGGADSSAGSTWADSDGDAGRAAADSDREAPPAVAGTGGRRPPSATAAVRGRPAKRRRAGNGPRRFAVLTGPTSSGKTAAVYAVAAELGYAVLEVSAATIRSSGRGLVDRLAEATQSQRLARAPDVGSVAAIPTGVCGDSVDSPAWATSTRSLVLLDDAETLLADERLFWLVLDGLVCGGARRPVVFTVNGLDADAGPVHRTLLRAAMSGSIGGDRMLGTAGDINVDGDGGFLVDAAAPSSRRGLGSRASRLSVALIHMARPPLAVASALLATAAAEQRISMSEGGTTRRQKGGCPGVDLAAIGGVDAALLAAATGRDLRAAVNALQFWGAAGSAAATAAAAAAPVSVAAAALGVACLPLGGHGEVVARSASGTCRRTVRALEEHAVAEGGGGLWDGDNTPSRSMALYAACADAGLLHSGRSVPWVAACFASASERSTPPEAGTCRPVDAAVDVVAAAELAAWARHLDILSETTAWADSPGFAMPSAGVEDGFACSGSGDGVGVGGYDGFAGGNTRAGEETQAKAVPAGAAPTSAAATAATDGTGRPVDGPAAVGDAGTVVGGAAESDDAEWLLPPPPVAAADMAYVAGALVAHSLASCLVTAARHKAGDSATATVERGNFRGPLSVLSSGQDCGSVLTRLCAYANAAAPAVDVDEDDGGAVGGSVDDNGGGGGDGGRGGPASLLPSPAGARRDYELLLRSPPLLWTALVIPHSQAAAVVPPSASRVRAAVDYFPALRGLALADGAGAEAAAAAAAATAAAAVSSASSTVVAAPVAAAANDDAAAATAAAWVPAAAVTLPSEGGGSAPPEGVPPPPNTPPPKPTPSVPVVCGGASPSGGVEESDVITRPRRTSRPRRAAAPRRRPRLAQLGFEAADVALLREYAMVSSWGGFRDH